jgi:hypothetical protein
MSPGSPLDVGEAGADESHATIAEDKLEISVSRSLSFAAKLEASVEVAVFI